MYYVYGYFEPGSETPFYIGKGHGRRMGRHFKGYFLAKQDRFHNKLRKMKALGIVPDQRKIRKNLSEPEALALEIELIAHYGRLDLGTGCLCNHTDGGEGSSGYRHSDESLQKIGMMATGFTHSIDTRIKISQASSEHRHTPETLAKMSQLKTEARGIPVCSYNLDTLEIVKAYPSTTSVKKDGFSQSLVSQVIRGQKSQHGGLGWRQNWPEPDRTIKADWGIEECSED